MSLTLRNPECLAAIECRHKEPGDDRPRSCWAVQTVVLDARGKPDAQLRAEAIEHFRTLGWRAGEKGKPDLCPAHAKSGT